MYKFESMFGIFKKKSPIDKLNDEYKTLMEESYRLSRTDRIASDLKRAEADEILRKIDQLSS